MLCDLLGPNSRLSSLHLRICLCPEQTVWQGSCTSADRATIACVPSLEPSSTTKISSGRGGLLANTIDTLGQKAVCVEGGNIDAIKLAVRA